MPPLHAVAEQEFPAARKILHRRHQPQHQLIGLFERCPDCSAASVMTLTSKTDQGFALDPRGKEVKIQVLRKCSATRNPTPVPLPPATFLTRNADRQPHEPMPQQPPRNTQRREFEDDSAPLHADPSLGAPR